MVTHRLWTELSPEKWSQQSIEFEHKIAELCNRIGNAGWTFDSDEAASLYAQLSFERSTLEDDLQTLFPDWVIEEEFIPKVNNKKLGYEREPFIKKKTVTFNPNSRKHIELLSAATSTTGSRRSSPRQAMQRSTSGRCRAAVA